MSITLSAGAVNLPLHPDLYWADEFSYTPVEQATERSVSGALIVDTYLRDSGIPITLQPDDDDSAWMTHATLSQLRTWAAVPGQVMVLTLRGLARTVIFRHEDGAIEAQPVVHFSDTQSADMYRVTLRLMEVEI
jgi:hypothetical protein